MATRFLEELISARDWFVRWLAWTSFVEERQPSKPSVQANHADCKARCIPKSSSGGCAGQMGQMLWWTPTSENLGRRGLKTLVRGNLVNVQGWRPNRAGANDIWLWIFCWLARTSFAVESQPSNQVYSVQANHADCKARCIPKSSSGGWAGQMAKCFCGHLQVRTWEGDR